MEPIVNKVAESGIISFDLETFFSKDPILVFDLKDYLFMGLILKEKSFCRPEINKACKIKNKIKNILFI